MSKNIIRKELVVSAIENGTVIDHIPEGNVSTVMQLLNIDDLEDEILIGINLKSQKYGKKGLIKIRNKYFKSTEINKIALVADTATIIEIKDFQVVNKYNVQIPKQVNGSAKCINPECITNHQNVSTKFSVDNSHDDIRLYCHYCEKYTKQKQITFV